MRDNAPQSIVSLQKIVFDRSGDLVKDNTIGIENLQHFEHIQVLVKNVLSENTRNEESLLNTKVELFSQLIEKMRLIETFFKRDDD